MNRRRRAAALRYKAGMTAPVVVAAGRDEVAAAIVRAAQSAGVPLRQDAALVDALVQLGAGATVPPVLYAAVAEVLAWVAEVDAERARDWPPA